MPDSHVLAWVAFNAAVLGLLMADLILFHRQPREMKVSEALGWSAFWVMLALAFNVLLLVMYENHWGGFGTNPDHPLDGHAAALQFLTGYLIELSLSVDNLFVFLAIFSYFKVKGRHQHSVLFWGILGAVVLRATMILLGVALIEKFHWVIYILGVFLVFTGGKLALQKSDEQINPEQSFILKVARRLLPFSQSDHGGKFFTRENGKRLATPLLLVLLVVEGTDVLFALDSIPAVLAITKDPFIAYSSNIMAILGLRALYFALHGLINLFAYLRFGLAAVLVFVGVKMLLPHEYDPPILVSLGVVAVSLGAAIAASLIWPPKPRAKGGEI
jgi:tellurite resistance protein TerC